MEVGVAVLVFDREDLVYHGHEVIELKVPPDKCLLIRGQLGDISYDSEFFTCFASDAD